MLVNTLLVLSTLLPALASSHGQPAHRHRRHANLSKVEQRDGKAHAARADAGHSEAHRLIRRKVNKRGQTCRPRKSSPQAAVSVASAASPAASVAVPSAAVQAAVSPSPAASSAAWVEPSAAPSPEAAPSPSPSPAWSEPAPPAPSPSQDNGNNGGGLGGLIGGILSVTDSRCGWCGADAGQPNGSQDWLNCGLNNGGWNPPYLGLDQLVAADFDGSGIFSACSAYVDKFHQYGAANGIPPIMLASFAMQESTCNPGVTGGGGEAGLMQIAPPNCEAGHNCWDVDYNINRGAQLFRQMIDANGGNVLAAIGAYNGWQKGMTYDSATAARWSGHCRNQNNLDYLYQFTNGWMQNKNAYSMGTYFNLKDC